MADKARARQMVLLDTLASAHEPLELDDLAGQLGCDTRTVRRDVDLLQHILQRISGIEVRRNKVAVGRSGYSPGYFTDQLEQNAEPKERIARAIVRGLGDHVAVALTAGSTPYMVAREIRRAVVAGDPPHNLIVFTNSVPALLELTAAGVDTGVFGEIYSPDDCALHSTEYRTAFQPGVAIVGASGILFGSAAPDGLLDISSHRAEEAAFMKLVLARVGEVIVAADHTKLGRRHPWSFGGHHLEGKTVRLVTDALTDAHRKQLADTTARMASIGATFTAECAAD